MRRDWQFETKLFKTVRGEQLVVVHHIFPFPLPIRPR